MHDETRATVDRRANTIADALDVEGPEVQQAFRYLFARVALAQGVLELIGQELRPDGECLVCREPKSEKLYVVNRPAEWTPEEEELYVAQAAARLLGV